jgi:hypothetical protein
LLSSFSSFQTQKRRRWHDNFLPLPSSRNWTTEEDDDTLLSPFYSQT